MRITIKSNLPLKYPARSPIVVPTTVPRMVAQNAITMIGREPTTTRENTSRPSASVPNQCAELGPMSVAMKSSSSGLMGTRNSPKIAAKTQIVTNTVPRMKAGLRRSKAKRSARIFFLSAAAAERMDVLSVFIRPLFGNRLSDSRIKKGKQNVGNELHHHYDRTNNEHCSLQHWVIAVLHSLKQ